MPTKSLFENEVADVKDLTDLTRQLCCALAEMPVSERIEALNAVRVALHEVSPFAKEPVDCVVWVRAESVVGNDYNPNSVAPPEMRLLTRSIREDGYTQPIVGFDETGDGRIEVVDGFHRHRVGKENKEIRTRLHGYLPVTRIRGDRTDLKHRIAATIRHNRARGVHGVIPMGDVVAGMIREGMDDLAIMEALGMEADELLRFKQNMGLPALFQNQSYSAAWE